MSKANKTTENNKVVVNINFNVVVGNDNNVSENNSQVNKTLEKKSALGELFNKVGKFIVKFVGQIIAMFLPRV